MKKYTYEGSFRGMDIDKESHILHNGKEYDLPEENEKVKAMLRKGELKEVATKSGKSTPAQQEIIQTSKGDK